LNTKLLVFLVLIAASLSGQEIISEKPKDIKPPYFRKEEIIVSGKRYRVHNNYLTAGPGFLSSSLRNTSQKAIGIDFQFHIRRQHFQTGVMMSGEDFGANNNVGAHIGYGYRKETKRNNYAFFVGPSYYTGVTAIQDSVLGTRPKIYEGWGIYGCAQAIYKLTFDIGFGAELFAEYGRYQRLGGIKFIVFFSGAYVGAKRNYNPNVRSQPK
jgi:hypothetical protein